MKDELKPRMNWPGKRAGIRAPEVGETPLSWEEVKFALGVERITGAESVHKAELLDDIDTWPAERRFIPAGLWGIKTPGLRRAGPFDALLTKAKSHE